MQGGPGYGYGGYGYGAGYDMTGYGNGGAYYTNDRYPAPAPAPAAYEDPLAGRRQHDFPAPLTGLEFQPSDACPKNYVIFDQTYDRSRVMYNPSLPNNLGSSGGNSGAYDHSKGGTYYGGGECSIRQKEDSGEIDALMSSEEEDDVLSTGRTSGSRGEGSPDSTCSPGSGYVVSASPSGAGGGGGERKKTRMRKMMKTLKGIIPGGDRMDTPAALDEAVKYLKSLKVEANKHGARGSRS
ncbi:transcription factor bHLH144-like [Hordeum vulgare subsp. vulgare]|uniref:Uncharacterized protein n=1 Tax=Hordeum vulgare subsp. vulgare TaxID=112509 RepID=A0A287PSL6_HORVV|nr:transcription factor bHLH144-like [Hordeum vulgare subsp. vulgare]XP_044982924.1 transcription factor bHLH144-like [Hordeum vulgare subsp. vulgare]